jgi:AcrR family transcriptional regulator
MTAAATRRKSAEERREEILAIAIEHFAAGGLRGTSTEVIAREAGISQAYLFRLFRTKQELFLACDARACEKVLETFRRAAAGAPPGEKLAAMGRAYTDELLPERHAVLMMMQGFAAAGADPEIRATVRQRFGELVMEVAELAGVEPGEVWAFFAKADRGGQRAEHPLACWRSGCGQGPRDPTLGPRSDRAPRVYRLGTLSRKRTRSAVAQTACLHARIQSRLPPACIGRFRQAPVTAWVP